MTSHRFTVHSTIPSKSNHPLYPTYISMVGRCHNPNDAAYYNYGGRGITVCDRWLQSFDNFINDLPPKPSDKHSLDRRDNMAGYSPSNCRWATRSEQNRNRRDNTILVINGQTRCLTEWAEMYTIDPQLVTKRLRQNWDPLTALTTPCEFHSPKCTTIQPSKGFRRLRENLIDRVFGKLTVTGEAPRRGHSPNARWQCRCECGATIEVLSHNLKSGKSKTCGKCSRPTGKKARGIRRGMTYHSTVLVIPAPTPAP